MIRYVIPLIVFVVIVFGCAWVLLNTPFFVNWFVPQFAAEQFQNFKLESFVCRRQTASYPEYVSLKDVDMVVVKDGKRYEIHAERINVHDFIQAVRERKNIKVSIHGARFVSGKIEFQGIKANLDLALGEKTVDAAKGILFAKQARLWVYEFQDVDLKLQIDSKKAELNDIKAVAYGGAVTAQISYEFGPDFNYIFWFEFKDIVSSQLTRISNTFFSKVDAVLSGSVRLVGAQQPDILAISLDANGGGTMDPSLFLPKEKELTEQDVALVNALMQRGGKFIFDQGRLYFQNGRDQEMYLVFRVYSKSDNMTLKGKIPFMIPEGIVRFLLREY
ncbi:MAG TPA: hypothetical protein P5246_03915 [Candidatus Omnitrophota bacterium]|nr:hypothetical protein [Candidatus Omnitrophota bacterium]HSA30292.1 hypothetical protein [Candidatus Omnitrophota bacterium]